MKKPAPVNSLLQRLLDAKRKDAEPVPPEYKTTQQWASEWGLHPVSATRHIREMLSRGMLKRKMFRVQSGDRLLPVPHYAEVA